MSGPGSRAFGAWYPFVWTPFDTFMTLVLYNKVDNDGVNLFVRWTIEGGIFQMTPRDRLNFFWSSGILPGTVADDLNDRYKRQPGQPHRRRVSWLQLLTLGLLR
jgi:hypothetical protein